MSANQRISNINIMHDDHNIILGLFQSGYRKFYLSSPKGYSRNIINAQYEENAV